MREFYESVLKYYPEERTGPEALDLIEKGVVFLSAAKTWWEIKGEKQEKG